MNRDFTIRLYEFEMTPPPGAWSKIESVLDEDGDSFLIGEKLSNIELTPPAAVWPAIASALDSDQPVKETPVRKLQPYYRYAAAAAILFAVIFTATLLFNNKQAVADSAQTNPVEPSTPGKNLVDPTVTEQQTDITSKPVEEENLDIDKRVYASASSDRKYIAQRNAAANGGVSFASYSPAEIETNFDLQHFEEIASNVAINTSSVDPEKAKRVNTYAYAVRPDGQVVRISRKLADMLGCIYSADCSQQVAHWHNKMAKANHSPSQENFMDILTLIKSLQEN